MGVRRRKPEPSGTPFRNQIDRDIAALGLSITDYPVNELGYHVVPITAEGRALAPGAETSRSALIDLREQRLPQMGDERD